MEPAHTLQQAPKLLGLPHLALYRLAGDDTVTFLQGQLTNDIAQLNPKRGLTAGFCTPKGRLLAVFNLLPRDNDLLLYLPREIAPAVIKRLSMYIMRSKVTITPENENLAVVGLTGPGAVAQLQAALNCPLPQQPEEVVQTDNITVTRLAGTTERFLLVLPRDHLADLQHRLGVEYEADGGASWRLEEIRAGSPSVVTSTQEQFVPQMLNMDLTNAINFKKGCYTGQEIIARTHYRGKVKRRMFRAQVRSEIAPLAGTPIHLSDGEQSVGQVVESATSSAGQCELLVVLQLEHALTSTLHLGNGNGPTLELLELPYPVELNNE